MGANTSKEFNQTEKRLSKKVRSSFKRDRKRKSFSGSEKNEEKVMRRVHSADYDLRSTEDISDSLRFLNFIEKDFKSFDCLTKENFQKSKQKLERLRRKVGKVEDKNSDIIMKKCQMVAKLVMIEKRLLQFEVEQKMTQAEIEFDYLNKSLEKLKTNVENIVELNDNIYYRKKEIVNKLEKMIAITEDQKLSLLVEITNKLELLKPKIDSFFGTEDVNYYQISESLKQFSINLANVEPENQETEIQKLQETIESYRNILDNKVETTKKLLDLDEEISVFFQKVNNLEEVIDHSVFDGFVNKLNSLKIRVHSIDGSNDSIKSEIKTLKTNLFTCECRLQNLVPNVIL